MALCLECCSSRTPFEANKPRERFLRRSLALHGLGDGSPFRLGALNIANTHRKVMVIWREDPSQISKTVFYWVDH
jgi:hypothetical protein